jgi:segregation and condensation protein A
MSSQDVSHTSRPDVDRVNAMLEPTAFTGSVWDAVAEEALAYPAVNRLTPSMDFRVELDIYRGPMDLLLYLVRQHELDITNIPVALVTEQYLGHLEVLERLDVDSVGDFVEVASLLIEIKSRLVLPQNDEEEQESARDDPRDELVQRLLEYKKYKDAASMLGESSQQWQQRFPRLANDLPPRNVNPAEQPIHEVELWDLVSAMGRVMRDSQRTQAAHIVYDDTPIHVHMQRIHDRLIKEQRLSFTSMFEPGMHKSQIVGVFLAVLELARNFGVVVEQDGLHADLTLTQGESFRPTLEISELFGDYEAEVGPAKPR